MSKIQSMMGMAAMAAQSATREELVSALNKSSESYEATRISGLSKEQQDEAFLNLVVHCELIVFKWVNLPPDKIMDEVEQLERVTKLLHPDLG